MDSEKTGVAPPHYADQQMTGQMQHSEHPAYQQPAYDAHNAQYPQQQQQQIQNQQQTQKPAQTYATAIPIASLQSHPAPIDCPNCHQRTMTTTQVHSGNTTHAWALGLFITTCCCCIPYLISATKDVDHKCGNCGVMVATWHRSGRTEPKIHG